MNSAAAIVTDEIANSTKTKGCALSSPGTTGAEEILDSLEISLDTLGVSEESALLDSSSGAELESRADSEE